jgi:hypothetical protein
MITDFKHLFLLSPEACSPGTDECVATLFKVLKRTSLACLPIEQAD